MTIVYGYVSTVTYRVVIPLVGLTSTWSLQTQFTCFNVSTSSPIIQVIAENVTISFNISTKAFNVTRGSNMYYASLNTSGSSAGSNSTTIKIYSVTFS